MNSRLNVAAALCLMLALTSCLGNVEVSVQPQAQPPSSQPPVEPTPVTPVDPPSPASTQVTLKMMIAPITPMVSVGQKFDLEVQIQNTGDATASGVAPSTPFQTGLGNAALVAPPTPAISDLAPGEVRTFRFGYLATDPGGINFDVDAAAVDIANDRAVTVERQHAQLVVEAAAALAVDKIELPAQAAVGADVVVRVTVSNPGQATARQLTPVLTSSAAMTTVSGPLPQQAELTGGASATFEWTLRSSVSGAITFKVVGSAIDDHSGAAISAAGDSRPLQIDSPASIAVMASLPQTASTGQSVIATVVVTNTGTAVAKNVAPAGVATITAVTGTAGATISAAPVGGQDIPGGSSATFRWTLAATGTGTLTLKVGFTGTDASSNTALPTVLATSPALQVLAPTALVVSQVSGPAVIGRGQAFTVQVLVKNTGGTGALGVLPSPTPLAVATTGGAAVTLVQAPAAQDIAAAAQVTYAFSYVETGAAVGTLAFSAGAQGTSAGTTAAVTAPSVQSALLQVVAAPALLTEAVTVPAKVSRGQAFDVTVQVFNSGGASVTNVKPAVSFAATGAAAATAGAAPAAVTLAAGARATIKVPYTAGVAGSGGLTASVVTSGTSSLSALTINAPAKLATPVVVQSPAQLSIASFTLPASIDRGTGFTLSLRVTNAGEADAVGVTPVPSPPMAVVTGGVVVGTTTTAAPVTIAGGQNQTFTWIFSETGTAPGTLAFNAGASGKDGNTLLDVMVAAQNSNSAPVATPVGCNGANLYLGVGGNSLDGDRIDLAPNTNRLRIKPYPMLPPEYQRVLATTPSRIQNQTQTFDAPMTRWAREQQLSGVSLYQGFLASFQGCLTFTSSATPYAAAPTAITAATECANFQHRFWSAIPTAAETQSCVDFAVSAANNDTDPRRRWAYVCASVLTSAQFLAD